VLYSYYANKTDVSSDCFANAFALFTSYNKIPIPGSAIKTVDSHPEEYTPALVCHVVKNVIERLAETRVFPSGLSNILVTSMQ